MLTANYLTQSQLPVDAVLNDEDKKAILNENEGGNFSYLCLMKEMFAYSHTTVQTLLKGWGGVKLVVTPEGYKKVKV